ncbi:prolyl 4-hydroxylase subunit alpha-1-like [Amblyomma americanum]
MQESLVTESLAYEDVSFFLWLEDRRLKKATLRYEQFLGGLSRHAEPHILTTFILGSRIGSLYTYPLFRTSPQPIGSLGRALRPPSFQDWWPTDLDLCGAAAGICKLQQAYSIEVSRMSSMLSRRLPPVSPQEMAAVARGCFAAGPFGNVSEWSRTTLERAAIIPGLLSSRMKVGFRWLQDNDMRYPLQEQAFGSNARLTPYPRPPGIDVGEYKSVCKQEADLRSTTGRLVCKMSTNFGDPQLLLQPLRIEVLSLKPRIVLLHGFLSPAEINSIRQVTRNGLRRGGVYTGVGPHGSTSWKRISKVAWLWEIDYPVLQRISHRIAVATDLSLESAEEYQVANYGLAGHYTPHTDGMSFDKIADRVDRRDGNRLATMLMYLSDVQSGGATAFVRLAVAVKPRAGAALFWYNLEPYEGDEAPAHFSFWHQKKLSDVLTEHVGCPVLVGSKWIITKWIHERTNVHVYYDLPD